MTNREIDALIAEKVMGWTWCVSEEFGDNGGYWLDGVCSVHNTNKDGTPNCPNYSTDIKDAFEIVEKHLDYFWFSLDYYEGEYVCILERKSFEKSIFRGEANTAALAICLAALKAAGVKI